MTKVTLAFAVLILALGLAAFLGSGRSNSMLLVPLCFGLILGVLGFMGIKREKKRKLFMRFNAIIAVVGVIWSVAEAISVHGAARAAGVTPDYLAMAAEITMAVLLVVYVGLYVRTQFTARRALVQ
jgi:hypothetical protein